jgi:hypothetical protein
VLELDLCIAADGYLCTPSAFRLVHGLQPIMSDVISAGLRVVWDPMAQTAGRYLAWDRVIVLAPWILLRPAAFIRRLLAHELAHHFVGRSEQQVWRWMERRYGDLISLTWPA